ncbi:MAG TPA: cyanophycin synthetase, partial [Emticicia sp.]
QISVTEKNTLVCDYYNANPSSMIVALNNFSGLKAEKKVIILGDMFELGEESLSEHRTVLNEALQIPASAHIFIGDHFYELRHLAISEFFFKTTEEAYRFLLDRPITDSTILIKGSRSMRMEKLAALL